MSGVQKIVVSFSATFLLVALAVVGTLWTLEQIESASEARETSTDLIVRANDLLGNLGVAEAARHGYVLTGDESFLQRYGTAHADIQRALHELGSRAASGATLKHVDSMRSLAEASSREFSEFIELRRKQGSDPAKMFLRSSGGGLTMDSTRALVHTYIGAEKQTLEQKRNDFHLGMTRMLVIIIVICGLALLLPVSFFYQNYLGTKSRLRDLVHLETQRLLDIQEDVNRQLQQTNASLQVSEEKLAVTLNSIDDAVIATDAEGRVQLLNPLAERLTGWSRAEALNRPVEDIFQIIHADTRRPYAAPVRETLATGTTLSLAHHTIVISRDGSECHIADSCAPIRDRDSKVVGAVLVFRDVTERKNLDQKLQDKNVELERTMAMAEKANLAKSEFLSSMSHELRTPLSAILGFAQLIDSGSPPPTASQKRSIDQILKAGWYLLSLINEILDLALIESGKLSLSMEPMSLVDVMHECHAMIEPQAQQRGISVVFPLFDDECVVYVNADRTRVKQILINLLSNAIKYNTSSGTVTVDCMRPDPGRIRVCVTDNGAGLSPAHIAQLFQPFNRLGQESNAEQGTGIGLVMSKRLIELMGGSIGVESTVGKGSTFWIDLNLTAEPQLAEGTSQPVVAPAQNSSDTRVLTLLYVEDNPANLLLVEDIIARRPDIHLLSARDGMTGVRMAFKSRPDVILMDINLPGISGMQALQILIDNPATAHIPVVALSANAMSRDIEKGLEAGFFRYLTKPIKVNEFLDTLDTAFKFAKTQAAHTTQEAKKWH